VHPSGLAPLTLGVEEEYLIVDSESGELVPRAQHLLAVARQTLGQEVEPELNRCQIEVGTPVCTTLDEVWDHLDRLRAGLRVAGDDIGLQALPMATHPTGMWRDQQVDLDNPRYARMDDVYRMVARQQIICGQHVHVGIPDPDLAIATMNRSRAWLPSLLALSANSPFWQGVDSGFDSYRLQVWQRWPTSGMPPDLAAAADYDELVAELVAMDAIEDATFLYWYVRPSARYPTIEFRLCDVCVDAQDAVVLAGLMRALAWTSAHETITSQPMLVHRPEVMEAAVWRAGRYGLKGDLIAPTDLTCRPAAEVIDMLLDHVRVGLEVHDDLERVTAGVKAILARGNGADFQRAVYAETASEKAVVDAVARQAASGGVLASMGVANPSVVEGAPTRPSA
jgi:carboxylate-amine ligase